MCMHDPRMGIGCTVMEKGKIDDFSLMGRLLAQAKEWNLMELGMWFPGVQL